MARTLLTLMLCLGVTSTSALAAGPQGVDTLMRHYDAADVASGKIHVSATGDVAYVSGVLPDGPWLDVWRRTGGEWKRVAEIAVSEMAPLRFGAKRDRTCRRTS